MAAEILPGIGSAIVVSAAVSFLLTAGFVKLARSKGVYARPGVRQSHSGMTPTGAGLGIVLALCLMTWVISLTAWLDPSWSRWIMPGALLLSVIGWQDDRRPVSPMLRFVVQLAVSFGLLALLRATGLEWSWLSLLVGGIMLAWTMNMYNFMDGSDGMAGFEGVFGGTVISVYALISGQEGLAMAAAILAACCVGFLPWNFPRPRIFMGDAGSVPLGFALGGLLVLALRDSVMTLPVALLVLSVFLVDSSLTLLGRVIRGERWYTPHKLHVYQRLIAHGWPHSRVLLLYQAINIVVVVPALALAHTYPEHAWPIAVFVALMMSAGWYAASLKLRLEMRT